MKDIKNYEGLYAVDENGNVWSYRSKQYLKPQLKKNGYVEVFLCKNGTRQHYLIHRLVAETFISNPTGLPQVNHKDEDKTNNCVSNLEWCDMKYNNNYNNHQEKVAKKTRKSVYCVELDRVFESQTIAAKETGIGVSRISEACRGITKSAGGYHWEFVKN